ncbi:MAG TPA: HNH endonuclease [Bryobacteraceae bacterium]|nr:HNH endonuclease [Bryobacteraceae bacterium]
MAAQLKKREWFDLGASAYVHACPGVSVVPTYVCPICQNPFTVEALDDGQLSVEHVPPQSVGGSELLLTCTICNNTAGTKLDAAAKTKEDVRRAMEGRAVRPHRVKASIGGITVNGQLHAKNGSYSLTIPKELNKPGTSEALQRLGRAGASLTVEHERYSELGARISWLRAGYLALVAMEGYKIVFDPAMDIVRTQIRDCNERRMLTFVADAQEEFPLTIRRVLKVLNPAWHRGWTVQFGRYLVNLPSLGDMTFYERLANKGLSPTMQHTTYEYVGWPTTPTFGIQQDEVA